MPTCRYIRKETKYAEKLIDKSLAMMTDKEVKAKNLKILGRYKQLLRQCGGTLTAQYIRQHCDKLRDYR